MSILVYSYPRSGNFFLTRAIAHTFESNIYHCLMTERIRDLHRLPIRFEKSIFETYCEAFGFPALQDERCHCTAEGSEYVIYKSHSISLVRENLHSIDCLLVLFRRPTNILRSHVQHQYLFVESLDDDLITHAKSVYADQLNFLENTFTIRACLEAGQDNWLQLITNSLLLNLPVFMVDYDDAVKNIWGIISSLSEKVFSRRILKPANYETNLSKDFFLSAQEEILDLFISMIGPDWDGTLYKGYLTGLTKWAYENNLRLVSKKNQVLEAIKDLPPVARGDSVYECIKELVPSEGLFLPKENELKDFLKTLLDRTSKHFFESKTHIFYQSCNAQDSQTIKSSISLDEIIQKAEAFKKEGKVDEIVHLFSRSVQNYSDVSDHYSKFKKLCDGRIDLVRSWIVNSVAENRSLYDSFSRAALDLYAKNEFMDAVVILSALVKVDPANYEMWNNLGVAFYSIGDIETAERCFKEALNLKNDYPEALKNLSILSEGIHDVEKGRIREIGEKSLVKEYSVEFNNLDKDAVYIFSFDVYPVNNGFHPDRHYGYWNTQLPIKREEKKTLTITWDVGGKRVFFDGNEVHEAWKGEFDEVGEYRISFILYKDGTEFKKREIIEHVGNSESKNEKTIIKFTIAEESQLKSAIWFITWRCNFRCPYCWEAQRQERGELVPDDFIDADRWVEAWNRLRPHILDITGGEPWLQPRFIELLEALDDDIKIAITTNASKDISQFVQRISPEKVFSMTLSLHPTQRMSTDVFLGKCLLLKNRGFNITVNYVGWPEQMWLIPMFKQIFEKNGIRFHIDPYSPTALYEYHFSSKEKDFLRQYVGGDRSAHWFGEVEKFPVLCSGGYNHLNVQPNGDAFRCIEDRISGKPKIGNILDPNFSLNKEWTYCDVYYRCPSCDLDKVSIRRLEDHSNTRKVSVTG